jgi:hypothetical protein
MRTAMSLLLGAGLLILALSTSGGAFPRTVLLEDFTNWG